MKEEIRSSLHSAQELEKLYRSDKNAFSKSFQDLYPEIQNQSMAEFWQARLTYQSVKKSSEQVSDWLIVILLALLAGTLAKFPQIFNWESDRFYSRNLGFLVFPFLSIFFIWKNKVRGSSLIVLALAFLCSALYINWLPEKENSQSLVLACVHLPILLWCLLAIVFLYPGIHQLNKRIDFLRFNGELLVMGSIIVLAGGLSIALSLGLFSAIGINLEEFYQRYVLVFGACATPIVATHLIRLYPNLVGRVSPIIARLFTPLVLITLLIYLPASLFAGKSPYQDREFLIVFNALLIAVMAIILFSVAEGGRTKWTLWVLLMLTVLTLLVNGIALSAIIFRISEWGLSPNRAAVLGTNVLILVHLITVTLQLFRSAFTGGNLQEVEIPLARFMPVYLLWAFFVSFFFPLIFQLR